jgi:hypothetical protein
MSTVHKSCKFRFNLLNYGKNTLPEIAHQHSLYICINILFNLLASSWKIMHFYDYYLSQVISKILVECVFLIRSSEIV